MPKRPNKDENNNSEWAKIPKVGLPLSGPAHGFVVHESAGIIKYEYLLNCIKNAVHEFVKNGNDISEDLQKWINQLPNSYQIREQIKDSDRAEKIEICQEIYEKEINADNKEKLEKMYKSALKEIYADEAKIICNKLLKLGITKTNLKLPETTNLDELQIKFNIDAATKGTNLAQYSIVQSPFSGLQNLREGNFTPDQQDALKLAEQLGYNPEKLMQNVLNFANSNQVSGNTTVPPNNIFDKSDSNMSMHLKRYETLSYPEDIKYLDTIIFFYKQSGYTKDDIFRLAESFIPQKYGAFIIDLLLIWNNKECPKFIIDEYIRQQTIFLANAQELLYSRYVPDYLKKVRDEGYKNKIEEESKLKLYINLTTKSLRSTISDNNTQISVKSYLQNIIDIMKQLSKVNNTSRNEVTLYLDSKKVIKNFPNPREPIDKIIFQSQNLSELNSAKEGTNTLNVSLKDIRLTVKKYLSDYASNPSSFIEELQIAQMTLDDIIQMATTYFNQKELEAFIKHLPFANTSEGKVACDTLIEMIPHIYSQKQEITDISSLAQTNDDTLTAQILSYKNDPDKTLQNWIVQKLSPELILGYAMSILEKTDLQNLQIGLEVLGALQNNHEAEITGM